jgi:exopolyphosphatase / guanosine-5'-triphosphate,3'-diphosphate pyrophosphatase
MSKAASIDIGTNTLRLLAAEVKGGRIARKLLDMRANTRLGEKLEDGGRLLPEAKQRTIEALAEFADALKSHGVRKVSAVATEAVRRATDADAFLKEVFEKTGFEVEVISGVEEAKRTLAGVKAGVGGLLGKGPKLVVDIGGGSTELVVTDDLVEFEARSIPVGAVGLYERFITDDPPRNAELAAVASHCYRELGKLKGFIPEGGIKLVGTAGTITTLAAVDMSMEVYEPDRVTGHILTRQTLDRLLSRFCGLTSEQRRLLAGLEPGREDIIVSGTVLLVAVMDAVSSDLITVCDYGLREGNLLGFVAGKGR